MFSGNFDEKYSFIFDKSKNKIVENVKFSEKYFYDYFLNEETEIKMIEKLCSIKSLKMIQFPISKIIDKNEILKNKNNSVKEMNIKIKINENKNCDLCNLQKIFFNLTNLTIQFNSDSNNNNNEIKETKIEIIENPDCKITSFNIKKINMNMQLKSEIQFCIQSYENLESINFENCITNFPIFNKNCNIIFKSLKSFRWIFDSIIYNNNIINILDSKINNSCDNIDKMPNLREFIFSGIQIFDEISYKHFIKKRCLIKSTIFYFNLNQ